MLVGKRRRLLDYLIKLISEDIVLSSKSLVSEKKLLLRKLQKGNSNKGCPFFLSANYMVK